MSFNVDHLGAEFRQLRADIRLGDNDPRADHPDAGEGPEGGNERGGGGPWQVSDPGRDLPLMDLNVLLVPENTPVMCHICVPFFGFSRVLWNCSPLFCQ